MPRPEQKLIQLTIDGREIQAVEGSMLVDAAKFGDVEIPYFCYEPKLGNPVGACRMCLVEIEGIPKLQTSCSTPVRDGMVVHTQTDRVRAAQNAVVEFLLVNHPLDCPVCDKGGECPLQDITFGWGLGRSRVVEPKRHFVKPLALSPLIAIDRERCILCYRCVRFSQEIAEDWQLIFTERGAHTFVGTHDGHPYVAPFSGNIIELCPVGALTSQPYRFRARPWDIEGAGGICTLCPSQCNVEFTVRDEKVMRVLSREHPEVDDGWLCDKGRFAYQAIHVDDRIVQPMVRDGGRLRPVSWERALSTAAGLARQKGHVAALVGGQATNEEAFLLQRLLREGLDSHDIDSRAGAPVDIELARALAAPGLQATVPDLEFAHTVLVLGTEPLDDAPILDLRIRKGVRRQGVKLIVASDRPSALDRNAVLSHRYAPGEASAFLSALEAALSTPSSEESADDPASAIARQLADGGEDVVILWGEGLDEEALGSLLRIAERLGLADREGAGLLEVPAGSNGRGIREAGALPNAGPGYSAPVSSGRGAAEISAATAAGEVHALYLLQTDPVRDLPDRAAWESAMHHAGLVVAHASVLTEGLAEHADVIFPAESSAEKEGTIVHPDGRIQRLRAAISHPGNVRAGWSVIAELARRCGLDLGVLTSPMAFRQLTEAVPCYAGLTLDEVGGRGVRWPEREQASAMPSGAVPASAGRAQSRPAGRQNQNG
jgi:NADH-quinone oxidoreductase subunit G